MIAVSEPTNAQSKMHHQVTWALIAGLLFLRLVFLGGLRTLAPFPWVTPVFETGTYLLTATFILWEIKHLREYHVDGLALGLIVLFKPLQTLALRAWWPENPLAFPGVPAWVLWLIAIGLGGFLLFRWRELPRLDAGGLAWFGLGILAGIGMALALALPTALELGTGMEPSEFWRLLKADAGFNLVAQMGSAAVSEEPLFRGFLWGALRKAGWKEVWIWLFQSALFLLGHIYLLGSLPLFFFVVVPAGGLVLGLVAWKSRRLSASMALHAVFNVLSFLVGSLVAGYLH